MKAVFGVGIAPLCGDASLETQNGAQSSRFHFSQADSNHRDYLFHLHSSGCCHQQENTADVELSKHLCAPLQSVRGNFFA